jgi:ABC-2 type transport system ATP-binding protein
MSEGTAVEVRNLSFTYPPVARGGAPRQALQEVSFTVAAGEIFGLLGPNGSGKTTLFRILSTLLLPAGGSVRILEFRLPEDARAIRRRLGIAFQSPSLDKKLTVEENLLHQGRLYGLRGKELHGRVRETLHQMAVWDRRRDFVEVLSGGLARRVEIAKTLLHRPGLLLLDEPSTGLDPGARRELWDHLTRLRDQNGATVLLTTHLMYEAAGCNRLALLDRGRLVALGSPDSLTSEIGGDIISIRAAEPEVLRREIREQFDLQAMVVDGVLRLERESGHRFIPQLVEAFPGQIQEISIGRPTLEDVFVRRTGHTLWAEA